MKGLERYLQLNKVTKSRSEFKILVANLKEIGCKKLQTFQNLEQKAFTVILEDKQKKCYTKTRMRVLGFTIG